MNSTKFLSAAGCLWVMMLSSCQVPEGLGLASRQPQEVIRKPILVQPANPKTSSSLYVWHGSQSGSGPVKVTIDLSQQKAYIFRDSENIGWSYVATGRSGYPTPTGTFRITEKIVNKRSNRYGTIVDSRGRVVRSSATAGVHRVPSGGSFVGAKMPYWMRLTGSGIGMHAGRIPNPGSPASHGCIRMPYSLVSRLYEIAPVGTEVTIVN